MIQLVPRAQPEFRLPLISTSETLSLLKGLKSSKSNGFDYINNKILKKIKTEISPHITYLINSCIKTSVFPYIFKLIRITPLNKPDKPPTNIASYRPINNLTAIEKVLEQYIITNLNKYLTENNILNKNHYGGRQGHSTTSALLQINNRLRINYELNLISVLLTTDLTAAYDTVDHMILTKKLEHYGIRNGELNLIKNYLSDRQQYVSIDTFDSDIIKSDSCSVVQGGKLCGVLYSLYTNEVPILHILID